MNNSTGSTFDELLALIAPGNVCVLSGAGMSTASGIPDYRGPTGRRRRSPPIQFNEFRNRTETRKRYWARSAIGWTWIRDRQPNAGHRAVAELEEAGVVRAVITQNVDGLHQRAGSRNVLDLHGTLAEVVCFACGQKEPRRRFQERIHALNPAWGVVAARMAPDGDADIPDNVTRAFTVPSCTGCGGVVKPDVVFFGESVPGDRVRRAFAMLDGAGVLLVLGSSLTVFSGFRFVKRAAETGTPIGIVTRGETRGDGLASVRMDEPLEELLPRLARALG